MIKIVRTKQVKPKHDKDCEDCDHDKYFENKTS